MKDFKDMMESKITIEENKKAGILATIKFPFGKADVENKNKRTYPLEIFKGAVEKLGEKIKSSFVASQTDHPVFNGGTRLSDVSHILKNVWMDKDMAYAEADILNTTRGSDVLKIIKSGIGMGASLRGSGEIGNDGKVKPGLVIDAVDLVSNPSFGSNAEVGKNNIMHESSILEVEPVGAGDLSNEEKRLSGFHHPKATSLHEEKIESRSVTESRHHAEYCLAGGTLSFKEWKEKNADSL